MNSREARSELSRMMSNPKTTIAQLRKLSKESGLEVWWSLRKEVDVADVNVTRGTVSNKKQTR